MVEGGAGGGGRRPVRPPQVRGQALAEVAAAAALQAGALAAVGALQADAHHILHQQLRAVSARAITHISQGVHPVCQ